MRRRTNLTQLPPSERALNGRYSSTVLEPSTGTVVRPASIAFAVSPPPLVRVFVATTAGHCMGPWIHQRKHRRGCVSSQSSGFLEELPSRYFCRRAARFCRLQLVFHQSLARYGYGLFSLAPERRLAPGNYSTANGLRWLPTRRTRKPPPPRGVQVADAASPKSPV
jgi:hypothetical protein